MRTKVFLMVVGLIGFGLSVSAATIPVTTTDPAIAADGQCSLIEAIVNANGDTQVHADCSAGSGADTINLASSATYELDQVNINFYGPNGLPRVQSAITIDGHNSTIRRASAAPAFRIFVVNSTGTLTLNDLTLEGGDSGPTYCGGALLNAFGSAALTRTTVTGNTAPEGGGICNSSGPMTLSDCVVTLNMATEGSGGGVLSIDDVATPTLDIDRTTVNDNSGVFGGGVATYDTDVFISDSTICDNTAETVGGGISVYRYAGTMAVEVELRNTIVAGNLEGGAAILGNCMEEFPATVSSLDFNLADDLTCNLVGTDDLVVADAMLGELADNGGQTLTHLPLTGSPAVDSGDDALCPLIDQLGNIRPWDGDGDGQVNCDRGAVELGAPFFHGGFEAGDTGGWSNTVP